MTPERRRELRSEAMRRKRHRDLHGAIRCLVALLDATASDSATDDDTASLWNYLAFLYLQTDQLIEAEAAVRESLRRTAGVDVLEGTDLLLLSGILSQRGAHTEAADAAERADTLHRVAGADGASAASLRGRVRAARRAAG